MRFAAALLLAAAFPKPSWSAKPVPPAPPGFLYDEGVVSSGTARIAARRLAQDEDATSVRFRVGLFSGLDGEDPQAYTAKVYDAWGLGRRGTESLLLAFFGKERAWRVQSSAGKNVGVPVVVLSTERAARAARQAGQARLEAGDRDAAVLAMIDALSGELLRRKRLIMAISWSALLLLLAAGGGAVWALRRLALRPRGQPAASNLGKYELGALIGQGGMGFVYAGKDRTLERPIAIKKMRPDVKLNRRDRERFIKEAKLSASLHHPCIVDVYDVVEDGEDIYLVFEFVDGETLDQRLDRGALSVEEVRRVLRDVCAALSFAHERKVAHRDLKPSNVMLTKQGFAKVMDFGIAREIKDTASRLTASDTSGTLAYMAPEQEIGRFDSRSDIFALGVTIYEALSGERPFPGPNFTLQKEKMVFRPLSELVPQAPENLRAAIERCLRYDAKERFQTVGEFAASAGVDGVL